MKIIAHRGDSGHYPENTMPAFESAAKKDCDEIELDIQCTKDGTLVVIHDETIDRVTDGTGRVIDYTYEELAQFNAAAAWKGKFGTYRIPAFEEYCKWAAGQSLTTNIELKTGVYYYEDIEEKAIELIHKYGLEKKAMFSSFNHVSLLKIKELMPEMPCGALVSETGLGNAGYYCGKYGFEYYHPGYNGLTGEIVENCKKHQIGINVWTVNDFDKVLESERMGCRGVITNYPEECRKWLGNE